MSQSVVSTTNSAGALSTVKVLDLTHFEAGPFATMLLAGFGAEVIKVERPGTGDASRMRRPGGPAIDAPYFKTFNAGKKSITLDMGKAEGKEVLKRLIAQADIVIENFSPGAIDRLGLGFDVAQSLNPRIIYAHICGFAPGSPFADFPAYDAVAQAVGGAISVTGEPQGGPLRPGINLGDSGSGMTAALALCAALFQRERTGVGQEIFIPMQDVVVNYLRASLAGHIQGGAVWPRVGNQVFRQAFKGRAPFPGPSDVFPCAGGGPNDYCFVHVLDFTSASYEKLFAIIERPELMADPRFADHASRIENMDALDAAVAEWCLANDKWTVMKRLGEAGLTAGAVADTGELLGDADLRAHGVIAEVQDSEGNAFPMPGFPARMPGAVGFGPIPGLGEDTDAVLAAAGYGGDEIAALREAGTV